MANGGTWPEEPACCRRVLDELEPRDRSEGRRVERHACPTCKRAYLVTFRCVARNGRISSETVERRLADTLRLPGRILA